MVQGPCGEPPAPSNWPSMPLINQLLQQSLTAAFATLVQRCAPSRCSRVVLEPFLVRLRQVLLPCFGYMSICFMYNMLDELTPIFAAAPIRVGGAHCALVSASVPSQKKPLYGYLYAGTRGHPSATHSMHARL